MKTMTMCGVMKGKRKRIEVCSGQLPAGAYNTADFARLFPDEYRNLRVAGFKGCDVGDDVTFTVKNIITLEIV